MATQAFVKELADALVRSYIERLLERIETARTSNDYYLSLSDYWDFISRVEFMKEAEWSLLKRAYKTEEDDVLAQNIQRHEAFVGSFARRYRFLRFNIAIEPLSKTGYCTIQTKDLSR